MAFAQQARSMAAALVDGGVGIVLAPGGRLSRPVTFTFAGDTIARVEIFSDPARVARLDIAVLD